MNNPKKILLLLSGEGPDVFLEAVQKHLAKVTENGKQPTAAEAKGYGIFSLECIQKCTLKLTKTASDGTLKQLDLDKVINVYEICCKCYLQVHVEAGLSDPFNAVKFIILAVNAIRSEVENAEHIITLAKLGYQLIEAMSPRPIPDKIQKVSQSYYANFWNTANMVFASDDKAMLHLNLRYISLMFLCTMSVPEQLCFHTKETLNLFMQEKNTPATANKDHFKSCVDFILWMVSDIIEKAETYSSNWSEVVSPEMIIMRLRVIRFELLLDLKIFEGAVSMVAELSQCIGEPSTGSLNSVVGTICQLVCSVSRLMSVKKSEQETTAKKGSKNRDSRHSSELEIEQMDLDETIRLLLIDIDSFTESEASALFAVSKLAIGQVPLRSTEMPALSINMIKKLQQFVNIDFIVINKLLLALTDSLFTTAGTPDETSWMKQALDKLVTSLRQKTAETKSDFLEKIFVHMVTACNRYLVLLYSELLESSGEQLDNIMTRVHVCVDTQKVLLTLRLATKTSLVRQVSRETSGFVSMCNKLAQHCKGIDRLKDASTLYKDTITLMQQNSSQYTKDAMAKIYTYLADSHRWLEDWRNAMVTVVQGMRAVSKATNESEVLEMTSTPVTVLFNSWTKIKRDAAETDESEASTKSVLPITLLSAMKHNKLELVGVPDLMILQAELTAFQNLHRRLHKCEYYILKEILNLQDIPHSRHAEHLIDMAICSMKSRLPFSLRGAQLTKGSKDKLSQPYGQIDSICESALQLLDEAISLLDQETCPSALASKALAFFFKFEIPDEIAFQQEKSSSSQTTDEDQSATSSGTDDQSKQDISLDKCIHVHQTLSTEEQTFLQLKQALDLWEKVAASETALEHFDIVKHLKVLMSATTRLMAVSKPMLAWKAIRTAHILSVRQSASLEQRTQVVISMIRVLINLGRYKEAELLLTSLAEDNSSAELRESILLLKAEVDFFNGNRQDGVDTVNQILTSNDTKTLTRTACLHGGSAKRLMSVFLSFSGGHVTNSANHNILSLASQAVQLHTSLVKCVKKIQGEKAEITVDLYMAESLQSFLNSSRLYRLVGDHAVARTYLLHGLHRSNMFGFPRWACEFLLEFVRLELMADHLEEAAEMLESLIKVLTIVQCSGQAGHSTESDNTTDGQDCKKQKIKNSDETTDKLKSENRKQLSQKFISRSPPECSCNTEERCEDPVRHRLCLETGILMAEFLSHCGAGGPSLTVLRHLTDKYDMNVTEDYSKQSVKTKTKASERRPISSIESVASKTGTVVCVNTVDKLNRIITDACCKRAPSFCADPRKRLVKLELDCRLTEVYLEQKQTDKVLAICKNSNKLKQSGYYDNVVHSNVLLAELVLRECMTVLDFNEQIFGGNTDLKKPSRKQAEIETETGICLEAAHKPCSPDLFDVQPVELDSGIKRKVKFLEPGSRSDVFQTSFDDEKKADPIRLPLKADFKTPSKRKNSKEFATPMTNSRRQNSFPKFRTPLSVSRNDHRNVLDFLMAEGNDEDKPIDQKSSVSTKVSRRKEANAPDSSVMETMKQKTTLDNTASVPVLRLDKVTPEKIKPRKVHKMKTVLSAKDVSSAKDLLSAQAADEDGPSEESFSVEDKDEVRKKFFFKSGGVGKTMREHNKLSVTLLENGDAFDFNEMDSPRTVGVVKKGRKKTSTTTKKLTKSSVSSVGSKVKSDRRNKVKFTTASSVELGAEEEEKNESGEEICDTQTLSKTGGRGACGVRTRRKAPSKASVSDSEQGSNSVCETGEDDSNKEASHSHAACTPSGNDSAMTDAVISVQENVDNQPEDDGEVKKPTRCRVPARRGRHTLGRNLSSTIADGETEEENNEKENVKVCRKGRSVAATTSTRKTKKTIIKAKLTFEEEEVENKSVLQNCSENKVKVICDKVTSEVEVKVKKSRPVRATRARKKEPVNEIELARGVTDSARIELAMDVIDSSELLSDIIASPQVKSAMGDIGSPEIELASDVFVSTEIDLARGVIGSPEIELARGVIDSPETDRKRLQACSSKCRDGCMKCEADELDESSCEISRSCQSMSLSNITQQMCEPELAVVNDSPAAALSVSRQNHSDIIQQLETAYQSLQQFPPCPRYADICQILALLHLQTDRTRAAFLLSEALAITFRHRHNKNFQQKMRKQTDNAGKTDATEQKNKLKKSPTEESSQSPEHLNFMLLFDSDDQAKRQFTDNIPKDWAVFQFSVIQHNGGPAQLFLTRFVSSADPVIIKLSGFSDQGSQLFDEFMEILAISKDSHKITDKVLWWKTRNNLDMKLKNILDTMSTKWIADWGSIFKPRDLLREINLDKEVKALRGKLKSSGRLCIDTATLEVLILCATDHLTAKGKKSVSMDTTLRQCVLQLLGNDMSSADTDIVISLIKKLAADLPEETSSDTHVILILDKSVQQLPWECLPQLTSRSVSRVPCLSYLAAMLKQTSTQDDSVYNTGVSYENTYYMLDCDGNLPHTREQFQASFESTPGWKGIVGKPPTVADFTDAITEKDLFIYCGHGNGGQYVHGDILSRLPGRSAAILMGCASGKLKVIGQLEPYGMVMNYFLSGCPCVVGNLWDVTDRDIDRFFETLLQTWQDGDQTMTLSAAVAKSRHACRMKYLVGAAPVVYGLPVTLKKS